MHKSQHKASHASKIKKASTAMLVTKQRQKRRKRNTSSSQQHQQLPGDFRVLMVKRSARTSFMKDLYVFPGGSVDESDYPSNLSKQAKLLHNVPAFEGNCHDLLQVRSNNQFVRDDSLSTAFAHRSAAFREIFEETSLLATPSKNRITPSITPLDLDNYINTKLTKSNLNSTSQHDKFHFLLELSKQLQIPIHEVLRRIIHLNDQGVIQTIIQKLQTSDISSDNNIVVDKEFSKREHSLLDVCIQLGLTKEFNDMNNINNITLLDTLHPVSKWVAPTAEKKRFDTVFYLSLLETDGIEQFNCLQPTNQYTKLSSALNTTTTHTSTSMPVEARDNNGEQSDDYIEDSIDNIMKHFRALTVLPAVDDKLVARNNPDYIEPKQPDVNNSTEAETIDYVKSKLIQSTLGLEIADINWQSPIQILQNSQLNKIMLAPPTQYLLSQLSSLTYDELSAYLAEEQQKAINGNNNNQQQEDISINSHIAYCPTRVDTVSFDPYTLSKVKTKLSVKQQEDQNIASGNTSAITPPNNAGKPHFDSKAQQFNGMNIKTKGYVTLPQDYEHPLTQQLLLHLFDIYEGKVQKQEENQKDKTLPSEYEEYITNGSNLHENIQSLIELSNKPQEIQNIILHSMSPRIPIANVHGNIPTPIDYIQQLSKTKQQQQHNNDVTFEETIYNNISHTNPIIQRYASSSVDVQQAISPLIHYHRIVDSFEHGNWEIIASNQNIIKYNKEQIDNMLKEQQQQYESDDVLQQHQVMHVASKL